MLRDLNYSNKHLVKYCLKCPESNSDIDYMPEKGEYTQIYSLDYFQILIMFQERKMRVIHSECWP